MLEAIIANRCEFMANYARRERRAALAEWFRLRAEGHAVAELANLRIARRWLHRDASQIPTSQRAHASNAVAHSPTLAEPVTMRGRLRQLWTRWGASGEQLVADLQAWLKTAEASDSVTLHEFSAMLRAVSASGAVNP